MNKLLSLFAAASIFQFGMHAGLKKDLNEFFDSFGASANVSSAEVYEGQKAGYATGGSVTVRNRLLNSKILTVNLPKINAGCGGIDIYAGGMSFVSSEKLIENLKGIASASAGYAFLLAIETVSPQISNQMKSLQSWANQVNGMGINSCETAARLVGSVWPQSEMASQHICRTMGTYNGLTDNYLESQHHCSTFKNQEASKKETNEKLPNLLYGNYNLAWKVIQQQPLLANHTELAELFMTVTGTVIVNDADKDKSPIKIVPSQITNEAFLKVLLEGGTGTIYRCTDKKQCLTIKQDQLIIPLEASWLGKIQKILLGIQNQILIDEELSEPERVFLSASGLPLYKIVNVLTAYKHGTCPMDLYNIADIVAMDMLMQCLKEGVEAIRNGCIPLKNEQMYAGQLDEYMDNLDRVRKEIKYYETHAAKKLENELEIMKKIQMLEEQIALELNL